MRRKQHAIVLLGVALIVSACATPVIDTSEQASARVRVQQLGTYPYHPVVFHLDLSILAYHLYAQTLVWPFDPYYEGAVDRDAAMRRVWDWVDTAAPVQSAGLDAVRGPGPLGGHAANRSHDPILFRYGAIDPRAGALTTAGGGRWTEFEPVSRIVDTIDQVWVSYRAFGAEVPATGPLDADAVSLARVNEPEPGAWIGAGDVLIAFEGGTGDKGESGQPHSQSLLGYALARMTGDGAYEVHIVFRGSRSGSATRAAWEALSTADATGSPDWITDLGFRSERHSFISARVDHEVARGMARSLDWTMPQILVALDRIVARPRAQPPTIVTVTGHSLGGALAQQFASALLLGDRYGPTGDAMPESLRDWPWANLKLVTFGAPRVGNRVWAEELTTGALESQFYEVQAAIPFDTRATGITNIDVVPRMNNPGRPVALRVLNPSDLITGRFGGDHVGRSIYLEEPDVVPIPSKEAHEPVRIRQRMLDALRDPRIPPAPWIYHPIESLTPTRDAGQAGTAAEYAKLTDTIAEFHAANGRAWCAERFEADIAWHAELLLNR